MKVDTDEGTRLKASFGLNLFSLAIHSENEIVQISREMRLNSNLKPPKRDEGIW